MPIQYTAGVQNAHLSTRVCVLGGGDDPHFPASMEHGYSWIGRGGRISVWRKSPNFSRALFPLLLPMRHSN